MDIHPSARKHGVADHDIAHVVENAMVIADTEEDPDKVLCLGPDRAGNLMEVVTVARRDEPDLVIHAMRMRAAYGRWLRNLRERDA